MKTLILENITNSEVKGMVAWAQAKPDFLPFTKACFRVADLLGVAPDVVVNICKPDVITEALIEEALRFPLNVRSMPENNRGQIIIF